MHYFSCVPVVSKKLLWRNLNHKRTLNLLHTLIIKCRGMSTMYVENFLRAKKGAQPTHGNYIKNAF